MLDFNEKIFELFYQKGSSLEDEIKGVVNYNVAVQKNGDNIKFLRKIVKGRASNSYGIAVAKLAGIPNKIIKRANIILKDLKERTAEFSVYD